MIRDRDCIYGAVVTRRLRAMGIRDQPTAPAPPWQNGVAERLIGSIRRECLDHAIICGEAHLRRVLKSHTYYYNSVRTHRSLKGRASLSRDLADRCHKFTPYPWWTSSRIRSRLDFRYTQAYWPCSAGSSSALGSPGAVAQASSTSVTIRRPAPSSWQTMRPCSSM
jgi:hypothetical protein